MNKFEKVPFGQFVKDFFNTQPFSPDEVSEETLLEIYDNIKLPQRATKVSAGYDFYSPFDLALDNEYLTIPTGIRWVCDNPNYVLLLLPRSGLGFKYGMQLRNTVGVIDADYANAVNYGHIMAKIATEEDCTIENGQGFMQGIIVPFAAVDDEAAITRERTGGFGSTTEA